MKDFVITLIDDEPSQVTSIKSFLVRRGFTVLTAHSGKEGLQVIRNNRVDLVFTDFRMPDMNGLDVLRGVKKENPEIQVVVMTAFSDTRDAVQVMKEGAFDYLSKPIDLDELEILVQKARELDYLRSENKALKEQLQEKFAFDAIISQSGEMEEVLNTAGRVAPSNATVLIRGESGTGKELVAHAVHFASRRSAKPMVTVNCAALSESLLESELFGHEKGAFTGATERHMGRFEKADGGTLFIDEIGDIPLPVQVKLLRALQFGEFERVGGSRTLKVDVRVLAATNRNLEEMIGRGEFREDLFYRINVVTILLPPLRDRKTDIPPLIRHFLDKYARENGKELEGISKEAQDYLMKYDFPGNIRELENIMERAVALTRGPLLSSLDFPAGLAPVSENQSLDPLDFDTPYTEKVASFERTMIEKALDIKSGNQSQAAALLGISERHLRSRMQKLEIVNHSKNHKS
ncbi:MAG: sigma-54 dependent transcriptional regulator [Bacteroidales bacterium]